MQNNNFTTTIQKFILANKTYRKMFESNIDKMGVHCSQHRILMFIAENGNTLLSQNEIAEKFGITPPAVAVTLKKLEDAGYIKRSSSEKDNRINKITLTEMGLDIVEKTIENSKKIESEVFNGFSLEEIKAFEGYLDRMLLSMNKYLNK